MLLKLLKYDMRSNLKLFLIIWPAIIVLAVINYLLIGSGLASNASSALFGLSFLSYFLAVFGIIIYSYISAIRRFYVGLLGSEGYFTFSLPVHPWQLIVSKLIVAVLTIVISLLIGLGSLLFVFSGVDELVGFWKMIRHYIDIPSSGIILLAIIEYLLSVIASILMIYLACALGHLFKRRRVFCSFLCYYGISVALQTISSVFLSIFNVNLSAEASALLVIVYNLFVGCVCFFLTEHILHHKLNLE